MDTDGRSASSSSSGTAPVISQRQVESLLEQAREHFKKLRGLFDLSAYPNKLLLDYCTIIAAFQDLSIGYLLLAEVDRKLGEEYRSLPATDQNKLTRSIEALATREGGGWAKNAPGLVMVGDAYKIFGTLIFNGFIFKDGTGPAHGEYVHSIQWLMIQELQLAGALHHPLLELYRMAVSTKSFTLAKVKTGEGGNFRDEHVQLWTMLVDCFLEGSIKEDVHSNVFANNYRTPAFITVGILNHQLHCPFLTPHLQARYVKRGWAKSKDPTQIDETTSMRTHHDIKKSGNNAFVLDWNVYVPVGIHKQLTDARARRLELFKREQGSRGKQGGKGGKPQKKSK